MRPIRKTQVWFNGPRFIEAGVIQMATPFDGGTKTWFDPNNLLDKIPPSVAVALKKDVEADAFDLISRMFKQGKSTNEMAKTIAEHAVIHAIYHLEK